MRVTSHVTADLADDFPAAAAFSRPRDTGRELRLTARLHISGCIAHDTSIVARPSRSRVCPPQTDPTLSARPCTRRSGHDPSRHRKGGRAADLDRLLLEVTGEVPGGEGHGDL